MLLARNAYRQPVHCYPEFFTGSWPVTLVSFVHDGLSENGAYSFLFLNMCLDCMSVLLFSLS